MIFPLHFSSRDDDPVITSEDNRHHGWQSRQLTAFKEFSFGSKSKQNISYILIPPTNILTNKTSLPKQLCMNKLPETVRSSAPSPLQGVPMATPLAGMKAITARYLLIFPSSLCQFRKSVAL